MKKVVVDFTVTLPPRSKREHGWTALLGCVGAIIAMALGLSMPGMACFGAFFGMAFGYHFAWWYLHDARERGVARDRDPDDEGSPR